MKKCSVEGCERKFYGKGLCSTHYMSARRNNTPGQRDQANCGVEACEKFVYGLGYCYKHWRRFKSTGNPVGLKNREIGTGTINAAGYKLVFLPGHPCADKRGLTMEHRVVMSEILGRPMLKHEQAHHLDGDKLNNDPSNLELWVRQQPHGQRVEDLVARAKRVLELYQGTVLPNRPVLNLKTPTLDLSLPGKITKNGYKMVRSNDGCNSSGYIMEHRLVMQQMMGRILKKEENVHHKDGNKLNNQADNLELWARSQPSGQRAEDLVSWASQVITSYAA